MKRVLLAGFKQETAVFNPAPTRYDHFHIRRGEEIAASLRRTRTEFAGGLDIFATPGDIEVVPTWAAWSVSGGPIRTPDLDRLIDELLDSIRSNAGVDGAYIVFHGAMAGQDEDDPEGRVLTAAREILGDIPLVISLDLHAVLTDTIASAIVPVDAPGTTSANLRSLPYTRCVRPIFPLDEDVVPPFSLEEDA